MTRLLWAMSVLFLLSTLVHGQEVPETESTVEQLLVEAASKKSLAAREISQLPERVEGQVGRIMARLDGFFRYRLKERFDTHYKEVEQVLQTVSLPEDVGLLEAVWQQSMAGTGIDSSGLEALVEDFSRRVLIRLEPHHEDLASHIDDQVKEILLAEVKQAQDTIRARFQTVFARYFPVWDVPHLHAPPLPTSSQLQAENLNLSDGVGLLGGIGVMMIAVGAVGYALKSLMLKRIRRRIIAKIAGKVFVRLIPLLGTAFLALDVFNLAQAKSTLEGTLRKQFLVTYQEELNPAATWNRSAEEGKPSTRQQIEQEIHTLLRTWSDHCRKEVERMLGAVNIFAISPGIQDHIAEQTRRGRDTRMIIEGMILVGEVFEQDLINQAPLEQLQLMIVQAPDKMELSRLARELGGILLREYAQHGRDVLVAAHRLGVPVFLEIIQTGDRLDWYDVHTEFEKFPRDMSEPARRGLLLALLEKTKPSGVATATLENIARHEQLFRVVAPIVTPDDEKLFRLFGHSSVVETVDRTYQKNPEAAQAFLSQWSFRTWERYRDTPRLDALLAVTDYRLTERKESVEDFARAIDERDELTHIFADAGLCGVRLWDAYVGLGSGQHQRKMAENAISLYKAGYPCDTLQTQEGLAEAQLYEYLPFGFGPKIQSLFGLKVRSLGRIAYVGSAIFLVFLLVAIPAVRLLRRLRVGTRPASPPSKPTVEQDRQANDRRTDETAGPPPSKAGTE